MIDSSWNLVVVDLTPSNEQRKTLIEDIVREGGVFRIQGEWILYLPDSLLPDTFILRHLATSENFFISNPYPDAKTYLYGNDTEGVFTVYFGFVDNTVNRPMRYEKWEVSVDEHSMKQVQSNVPDNELPRNLAPVTAQESGTPTPLAISPSGRFRANGFSCNDAVVACILDTQTGQYFSITTHQFTDSNIQFHWHYNQDYLIVQFGFHGAQYILYGDGSFERRWQGEANSRYYQWINWLPPELYNLIPSR